MYDVRGKNVLVMGLGINAGGLGVTRFLVGQGADVTVTDLRSAEVLAPSIRELEGLPVRYVLGEHRDADFREADIVIRNPGVPRESRYLAIAREHGAAIEMEMTLFFRLCPGPIAGITGTRGKTTTTMLAGAIFAAQWPETVVAGNLRVSALEQLPRITASTPVILELSSWQLEGLGEAEFSPHIACVTNLSPDHLDRYGSMEEYGAAKQQIFLHQQRTRGDVAIFNADDERVRRWAADAKAAARIGWFSTRQSYRELEAHCGPDAAWWDNDRLMWRDEPVRVAADIPLQGEHNRANIAAATALAKAWQPPVATTLLSRAIGAFGGVPDRLELIRERAGVRFVNDTTATTPTATSAALQTIVGPVVLIAGGADKRLDFEELAELLARRGGTVRTVLLAGNATGRLAEALSDRGVEASGPFASLAAAVQSAVDIARPGDTVLLSPGCASFGMFVNEFERGDQFRRIVMDLP